MFTILGSKANSMVTLLLVVFVSLTLSIVSFSASETLFIPQLVTIFGVLSGCYALAKLRPQRLGLSPPHVMLSLGFGGMLLGLFVDLSVTPIAVIAGICSNSQNLSLLASLKLHLTLMPYMHVGMLLGGILAIPSLRYLSPQCRKLCSMLTQNTLCSAWMLIGMTLGAVIFTQLIQSQSAGMSLTAMLGGMFTGMAWGMVLSVFLYRQYFNVRDALDTSKLAKVDRS